MTRLNEVLSRRRTLYSLLLLVCAGLSLHPLAPLERGLEVFFLPTRWIAEVVAPLGWLGSREVRAAEEDLFARAAAGRGQALELLAAEQRAALPTEELRAGRRLVHGEVIRRSRGRLDSIAVRVATRAGLAVGQPVVCGDEFVGRIADLDSHDAALIHVELVTGKGFFVGAEVFAPEDLERKRGQALVVGGLTPEPEGKNHELHLALHRPRSSRARTAGAVLVREIEAYGELYSRLATGYSLGQMETLALKGGGELTRITPELDFQSGLFQVVVLTPLDPAGTASRLLELDTFVDSSWVRVKALTGGVLSATREGRRLSGGRSGGVLPGRAVAFGAHFVGRVGEVSWASADLLGLGDPGLRLVALAQLEGDSVPRPLGELVALGRRRSDGRLRFRWTARVEIGAGAPIRAQLFTGSGEAGVPRGLIIGEAILPTSRGVHEILVEQDPRVLQLEELFVWRGHAASGATRPGTGGP